MKLFRHLKEKRYLILTFTLPAILLALAIVFLQPAQNHAKVQVKVGTSNHHQANPRLHPSHRAQVRRHLLQLQVSLQANLHHQAQR